MGRDVPRFSCVKNALHRQIFVVGRQQFVDRKHLRAALCSTGYGASTVARKVRRRLSVGDIVTPLKNDSVRSSGRFQGDVLRKGKAIPLQAWTGPEGSCRLRLPDFKQSGTRRW